MTDICDEPRIFIWVGGERFGSFETGGDPRPVHADIVDDSGDRRVDVVISIGKRREEELVDMVRALDGEHLRVEHRGLRRGQRFASNDETVTER